MKALILSAKDIEKSLDLDGLRTQIKSALISVAKKEATHFDRTVVRLPPGNGLGFMPGFSGPSGLLGYKAVSVFHKNSDLGLNPHQGTVVLLDPATGQLKAILDGSMVTALRTAAASGAATEILSREGASTLSLVGAGTQAYEHARALMRVRPIKRILIWNKTVEKAARLAQRLSAEFSVEAAVSENLATVLSEAEIGVTCTSSATPLLSARDFPKGAHFNIVGSSRPGARETDLMSREGLRIFLDSEACCKVEAEEILTPMKEGRLGADSIMGEIGACLSGQLKGRVSDRDITLFKSVGFGLEDVFAAEYFYQRAMALGLGTSVDLS